MRIAVNTRLLLKGKLEGIGNYAHETLQRMAQNHPEHEFIFFFDRTYNSEFVYAENVTPVVIPLQSRHAFLHIIWFNFLVPYYLKKHKADLFFSPDSYLSLGTKIPQIPVIHDLNFEHRPQDLPFWDRWHYRRYFKKFVRKARHIIAVSEYTKKDIQLQYGIAQDKVSVVHNGVKQQFQPCSESHRKMIREKYTQASPFIIYVGSIHARKNVDRLIAAFDLFQEKHPEEKLKLVLAGAKMWRHSPLEKWIQNSRYPERIVCTGRMEHDELSQLLPAAEMLCYVTLFEGFGVPVIEAQQAGIPVLCSNNTSLPEVAGDAALQVSAEDTSAIAEGIKKIYFNKALADDLVQKGLKNCQRFDWDESAKKIMKIITEYGQ